MSPQEEMQNLSMQLDYLEQTAEALQQQLSMISSAMSTLNIASRTLNGIEKEKENAEMLIPIGNSSYLKVKLADPDKVIVGLGAGVTVERTLQETKAMFKERQEQMEKAFKQTQQQFAQVAERVTMGRRALQGMLAGGVPEGNP